MNFNKLQNIIAKAFYVKLEARDNFALFSKLISSEINQDYNLDQNWVFLAQSYFQSTIKSNTYHRCIFNIPPRTGKTSLITLYGACWLLGRNPNHKILIVTSSDALRSDMYTKINMIINSETFKIIFPKFKIETSNLTTTRTKEGGFIRRSVAGSNAIGQGYHFIFFDDFFNPNNIQSHAENANSERHLRNFLTRKEFNPKTKVFVIEQRLFKQDATGILSENWKNGGVPYLHLIIPFHFQEAKTIHNIVFQEGSFIDARFNETVLKEIKAELNFNENRFQALYQQEPQDSQDAMIVFADYNFYNPADLQHIRYAQIIIGVDAAMKGGEHNDYSAFVCIGCGLDRNYYLLDAQRVKKDILGVCQSLVDFHDRVKTRFGRVDAFIVESAAHGIAIKQMYENKKLISGLTGMPISCGMYDHSPYTSKINRVESCNGIIRTSFKLPKYADWINQLADYKYELECFPNGKNDDFVDATTMILNFKSARR